MDKLSQIFKALSEPLRLRILRQLLHNGKEAYGEELAGALGIPAYQLSRHLKVLKTTGLIRERRESRWVYYSLAQRHGTLMHALRHLIAQADGGSASGNGHARKPSTRRRVPARRSRRAVSARDEFNWNAGPAVPGVL